MVQSEFLGGLIMMDFFENTMAYMNWKEIKEAGEKKLPVLFPLGVIEEHGPHLPLGSDILWSNYICKEVKRTLSQHGKETVIARQDHWNHIRFLMRNWTSGWKERIIR